MRIAPWMMGVGTLGILGLGIAGGTVPAWAASDVPPTVTINGTSWVAISTAAQLLYVDQNWNADYKSANLALMTSITLPSGTAWQEIGANANPFRGVFNGNGYTISGVNVRADNEAVGMFGEVAGTIENLVVQNASVYGYSEYNYSYGVGGLVGWLNSGASIQNCSFSGSVQGIYPTGGIGGLVGYNQGSITNTDATGTVQAPSDVQGGVGGLVGFQQGGSIDQSYANVSVSGGSFLAGDIVGNLLSGGLSASFYNANDGSTGIGFQMPSSSATATGLTSPVASDFTDAGWKSPPWTIPATGWPTLAPSATAEVPTVTTAPTALAVTNVTASGWTLGWNAVPNAATYAITLDGQAVATTSTTAWTYGGATPDTTYTVGVAGVNTLDLSGPSATTSVTTAAAPIHGAPSGLTFTGLSTDTWTATWQPMADATAYQVTVNGTVVATVTGTSWVDVTAQPATTYTVGIAGVNATGQAGPATTGTVTTPGLWIPPTLTPLTVVIHGSSGVVQSGLENTPTIIAEDSLPAYQEERAAIETGASLSAPDAHSVYLWAILTGQGVGLQQHVSATEQGQFAALYQRLQILPTWTGRVVSSGQGVAALHAAGASSLAIANYLVQIDGYSWPLATWAAGPG